MELSHVIYNSAAVAPMGDDALAELLQQAQKTNAALNITGMLLYADGSFFQVLEGPADAVDTLIDRITIDPRHERLTVIIREPIARRAFAEWSMSFGQLDRADLRSVEGVDHSFADGGLLTRVDEGRARNLLEAFSNGRWRMRLADHWAGVSILLPDPEDTGSPNRPISFQPVVDSDRRSVVAYEARSVVHREQGGAGLSDLAIRDAAIADAARMGLASTLIMQVPAHALCGPDANVEATLNRVEAHGLSPADLLIEIDHDERFVDPLAVAEALREARKRGMRVSIGHFGYGRAGLELLEHYRPDALSPSSSLTRGVDVHGLRQATMRGVVSICSDLGIDVIAKEITTVEEYSWLVDEGVTRFQGELFGPAIVGLLPKPLMPLH